MKNYFKKGINYINRKKALKEYRRAFDNGYLPKVTDIFDYNFIIKPRPTPYYEKHTALRMYGIGYQFHRATGYEKPFDFLVEHSINSVRTDNTIEYLENDFPVVLTPSRGRWEVIQPLTHKLVIPYGPNTLPYAKPIYADSTIEAIKRNLGKTLVVYPQHNDSKYGYFETQNLINTFVDYIEKFKEEHGFDTVICCMYFRHIIGCEHVEFEKRGWKLIACGNHENYDFGDIAKTLYRIADFVIAQGSYATNLQATYMGVPSISLPGNRKSVEQDGSIKDMNQVMGDQIIFDQCCELFDHYTEEITPEQLAWATKWGGLDVIKTPEEIRLIEDYAREIWGSNMKDAKLLRVLAKKKYEIIRPYIKEALDKRA